MSVEVRGLWKSFGGTPVLRNVDLTVKRGEIHALVGANGSGKTTLIKTLCGNHRPDGGEIAIRGKKLDGIGSPRRAAELGIRVVHQEAPLIDILSVAECMALFRRYPTGLAKRIRWRTVYREAEDVFERFGVSLDPRALASSLSAPERALVALAVALADTTTDGTSLLILDEASASVPEASAERFLTQVRKLAQQGVPILMVTHRLKEVAALADQVTVLDDGRVAYQGPIGEISVDEMLALISGGPRHAAIAARRQAERRERPGFTAGRPESGTTAVFGVEDLTTRTLRGVTFGIAPGEILGIVGGPESGIDELPLALVGALPAASGAVSVDGVSTRMPRSPRDALKRGIVLVPRDRLREGGIGSLSIHENVLLPTSSRYWHRRSLAQRIVADVIRRLDVRPAAPRVLLRELSGGNQQKVILGKWLNCDPHVVILDDPTSGIDPAARQTIFNEVKQRAEQARLGVLLFSTEPEQLAEHCDRVVVLSNGRSVDELTGAELSHATVARWAAA